MMKKNKKITVYDENDTTFFIDKKKSYSLKDIGFKLPKEGLTKVISIRLPTSLYNRIRAFSTQMDVPYQAYIKYILDKGLKNDLKSKKNIKKIKIS